MYSGYITDVEGIKVGHSQSNEGMTGCTVVICEDGATAGVDVRGSAPGTRETDLLNAEKMVNKIHAVLLSGGSAFGLDAAGGVMKFLEDKKIGFDVGVTKVPIVSGAVIFDLDIGDYSIRPNFNMGYLAAKNAKEEEKSQGNIGCGMGATVGKILGPEYSMKSGIGSASMNIGNLWVGAIIAVNSFGDVYDYETNNILAGAYDYKNKKLLNSYEIMKEEKNSKDFSIKNTTIGVVATNGILSKPEANKVAQMAQNGLARSINPIHTMYDGDTIFTMSTGKVKSDVNLIGTLSSEVVSRAITNAILSTNSYKNILSYEDLKRC
ncbi:P1 family peptidase [Anaerosalibacter bizertensis]|uniref:P1 family peptidase n=1 Tax=Anaerosalibacter bizertensis TaxID=932217 RepID=UPI001D005A34|nr:P1 family peptidase [Anaerosalibacter bizertensis]MBV1817013.1 P1 family peptidase [Bacteroidales bacterium MSK.15.36]MCB5558864.1 P1 family peptidase [Anaerosalibacter bizertensis]MCG4582103.1 P1 family peptidase [Anaerosalibacter bizertensis]MCG4585307.1 P1 family peptidase [Anaerosalibacter bizertensis]